MSSMYLLIPLSLALFVIGIWAIYYAVKSNQFEDLDNASQRIILDDRQARRQVQTKNDTNKSTSSSDTTNQDTSDNTSAS